MNPLSPSVLRWAVIVAVLVAVVGQAAGDRMTPEFLSLVSWVSLLGLLAAVLLFTGNRAAQPERPSGSGIQWTTGRINILFVVATVATVVLLGGLLRIDPELLKLFSTGAFLVAKDVLQSDNAA